MPWETVERPGYLGAQRDAKYHQWDQVYGGRNGWRLAWNYGQLFVAFAEACKIYEDAYFEFLKQRPDIIQILVSSASNVYDDAETNVHSGFDYGKQETSRTHIQDIAIRNCLMRMGLWFSGAELIQIRGKQGPHKLSILLSPDKIPFHTPKLILDPPLVKSWWGLLSVEDWYQRNKVLQKHVTTRKKAT